MAGKNADNSIRCSFCNKTQGQVRKLIAGPAGVYICDECVDICSDILEEELEDEEDEASVHTEINVLKPKEIKSFLDEYVIGQEAAKRALSVAVYNHYKRVTAPKDLDDVELTFEQNAIEAIADQAFEKKTGARGLRSIMESIMMDIMYEIPSDDSIETCIITKEAVEGGEPTTIRRKPA